MKIYPNGDKYNGEWKNGKKEGKGEIFFDYYPFLLRLSMH